MKRISLAAAALAGTAVLAASPAFAITTSASDNISVTLTVEELCTITAPDFAFPTATFIDSVIDLTGDISVRCTKDSPYKIGLDGGLNGTVDQRKMISGSNTIDYQFYSDSNHSVVWGTTVGAGENTVNSEVGGATADEETHTIYARIPVQDAPAGDYTDTVTATIWYAGGAPE